MKQHERKNKKTERITFDHWSRAFGTALYYGFNFIETPIITPKDSTAVKGMGESNGNCNGSSTLKQLFPRPEEKATILRNYLEKNMQSLPQPVMLYFEGTITREAHHFRPTKERVINLEILGSSKSIAEAMIIQATNAILKEYGVKDITLEVNSIGDKDSIASFIRELNNYYRKNIDCLPATCRQAFKKSVFDVLNCDHEKCKEIRDGAPHAMNFLSEPSRIHFKELLEYIEASEIPYILNNNLVSDRNYCSHAVFEFIGLRPGETVPEPLAFGIRYNALSKEVGFRKELGAIGVTISFTTKMVEKFSKKSMGVPRFYFIQMGDEAKHKSLHIIEMLREAGVQVLHNITRDKLAAQLGAAESSRVPYIIIMGQKEYVDGVVIVRRMSDRSQETIKIPDLAVYLKKLA